MYVLFYFKDGKVHPFKRYLPREEARPHFISREGVFQEGQELSDDDYDYRVLGTVFRHESEAGILIYNRGDLISDEDRDEVRSWLRQTQDFDELW